MLLYSQDNSQESQISKGSVYQIRALIVRQESAREKARGELCVESYVLGQYGPYLFSQINDYALQLPDFHSAFLALFQEPSRGRVSERKCAFQAMVPKDPP